MNCKNIQSIARIAGFAAVIGISAGAARADRVILTPSATALYSESYQADIDHTFSASNPLTTAHVNAGTQYVEFEAAEFHNDHQDAVAISAQTQVLPEGAEFPSVSLGVRDIGNMSHSFGQGGYNGRGYYLVGGRTPVALENGPFPLRNLTVTMGVGAGSIHGFFGSLASDFPFHLRATVEWDSREFNARMALPVTRYAQLEYSRMSGEAFVGLEVHKLTSF